MSTEAGRLNTLCRNSIAQTFEVRTFPNTLSSIMYESARGHSKRSSHASRKAISTVSTGYLTYATAENVLTCEYAGMDIFEAFLLLSSELNVDRYSDRALVARLKPQPRV